LTEQECSTTFQDFFQLVRRALQALLTDALAHTCIRQFDQLCVLFEDKQRETKFNISYSEVCKVYDRFNEWAIQSTSPLEPSKIIDILKTIHQTLKDRMTLVCAIASGKRSDSSSLPILQALEIRAEFLKIAGILNQALDGSGCEDIADISGNFWLSGTENNPALQGKDMADCVTDPALENHGSDDEDSAQDSESSHAMRIQPRTMWKIPQLPRYLGPNQMSRQEKFNIQ
jgi:hypothetical protein